MNREEGLREQEKSASLDSDAGFFFFPTEKNKTLGPFRRPLQGAGSLGTRKEEQLPPVGSREVSFWLHLFCFFLLCSRSSFLSCERCGGTPPPLWSLDGPSLLTSTSVIPSSKPGCAQTNRTERRSMPTSQSPPS